MKLAFVKAPKTKRSQSGNLQLSLNVFNAKPLTCMLDTGGYCMNSDNHMKMKSELSMMETITFFLINVKGIFIYVVKVQLDQLAVKMLCPTNYCSSLALA